jgi:hypothetical protein
LSSVGLVPAYALVLEKSAKNLKVLVGIIQSCISKTE